MVCFVCSLLSPVIAAWLAFKQLCFNLLASSPYCSGWLAAQLTCFFISFACSDSFYFIVCLLACLLCFALTKLCEHIGLARNVLRFAWLACCLGCFTWLVWFARLAQNCSFLFWLWQLVFAFGGLLGLLDRVLMWAAHEGDFEIWPDDIFNLQGNPCLNWSWAWFY